MLGLILIVLKVLVVLVAAILVGLILVQRSSGAGGLGGLAGNIGEESLGAGAGSAFRKATVALAIFFLVLVLTIPVAQAAAKRARGTSVGDLPGGGRKDDTDGATRPEDGMSSGTGMELPVAPAPTETTVPVEEPTDVEEPAAPTETPAAEETLSNAAEELPVMTTRHATVQNAHGIHCRPSSMIMTAVKGYEGKIKVSAEAGQSDLRSIYDLLCLALQEGQQVTIEVDGPDEDRIADKLAELFETHFDFPPQGRLITQQQGAAAMKSAYERALERFGDEPVQKLSDEQKAALAEVDKIYQARIAEARLGAEDKLKATREPAEQQAIREQLTGDIARFEERREREKDKVRNAD